jgi:hypothetical protein
MTCRLRFFCCLLSKAVFGNMQASCRPHAMDVLLVAKRPSVMDLSVAANRPYAIDLVHMANQPHAMDLLPVANRPFAPKAVFRFTVFHCFFIICEGFFSFTQTKNGGIV